MANMRISLFGLLYGALSALVQAQAPELVWQRCLGGTQAEDSWGVQITADGGIAVLGTTNSTDGDVMGNHGLRDYWLTKLDSAGNLLWQLCYGGLFNETAKGLLATSDGGFLLLGTADSMEGDVACGGLPQGRAWAVKVDPTGAIQWQSCLWGNIPGGIGPSWSKAVETDDGDYMFVGGSSANQGVWHENHGQADMFVAKLNATGQLQWLHCYGGSGREDGYVIQASPDGNYVVAGTTGSSDGQVTTGSIGQVWVIKIDPDGNLLWNRRMGGSNGPGLGQEVRDLVVDPDGSIVLAASAGSNDGDISGNHGMHDFWLVRLSPDGDILGQRCFGGTGEDYAWGIVQAGGEGYVVAGGTTSNDGDVTGSHGGSDAWVIMVDTELNLLWQKCLGGSGGDAAFALARTPAGETIISGYTNSTDGDVSGLHTWADDIWVVKLAGETGTGIPGGEPRMRMNCYPSPAHDKVTIDLPADLQRSATMEAMDINGRVVWQRMLDPGMHTIQIALEGWAQGVYCLRLSVEKESRTTRFVKQ